MSDIKAVSVAEFKRDFARFATDVERGGSVLVTRHGKPVGAFVPAASFTASTLPINNNPGGWLSLLGILEEWDTMEQDMAEVVRLRHRERPRPVPPLD